MDRYEELNEQWLRVLHLGPQERLNIAENALKEYYLLASLLTSIPSTLDPNEWPKAI